MSEKLAEMLAALGFWAIPASLAVGTLVNLIGFVPSVAVTAANVLIWGPRFGFLLSWAGEILGSAAAFGLYRAGIRAIRLKRHLDWKWVRSLGSMPPRDQFIALTLARVMPLVPSGAVNLAGSLARVPFHVFLLSTAIGKVPSIALETLVSHDMIHLDENAYRLVTVLAALGLGAVWLRKRRTGER